MCAELPGALLRAQKASSRSLRPLCSKALGGRHSLRYTEGLMSEGSHSSSCQQHSAEALEGSGGQLPSQMQGAQYGQKECTLQVLTTTP